MDFPPRDVTTSVNHRQQPSSHHLPGLISCECICNSRYMHRPYYQQSLRLQGHMVTDWVDWLQVSISLMPGGLSLQMALSLLTLRKKKLLGLSFLFSFIFFLSSAHVFVILSFLSTTITLFFGWLFNKLWSDKSNVSCIRLVCLVPSFMPSLPSLCMGLLMNLSSEGWAMERRTGPMLSPVKRERVDAKYRPPSLPL